MRKNIRIMPQSRFHMSNLETVEREVLSLWEDLAEARGFNRMLGRVIFTLLMEEGPLSQQGLAEKTGYSIPTISRALNTLVSLGTGRRTRMPGSRLTLYYVEMRPQDMLSGGLERWVSAAKTMQRRISSIRRKLDEVKGEPTERAKKLDELLTRFSLTIPGMIEIMEKAIEEIREIS